MTNKQRYINFLIQEELDIVDLVDEAVEYEQSLVEQLAYAEDITANKLMTYFECPLCYNRFSIPKRRAHLLGSHCSCGGKYFKS